MTSCVLSLFFLVSLLSSITAVDLTAIKIRITDKAQDVLKDVGLTFLEELVNKRFDFPLQLSWININFRGLTFTRLTVDPAKVSLSFIENSGLQFEIKNLVFTGEVERDVNLQLFQQLNIPDTRTLTFGGEGVSATIGVRMTRNQQRRLNVEIINCRINVDTIAMRSSGILGRAWDTLQHVLWYFYSNQLCPAVQTYIVPFINSKLESIPMIEIYKIIKVDYLLSEDITVTSHSLDVPLLGLVFNQGEVDISSIKTGTGPVFREEDRMAYVGISEFFFNSAAILLSNAQLLKVTMPGNAMAEFFLKTLQLFRKPSGLRDNVFTELEVTEAPVISISQNHGVTVNTRVRGKAVATNQREPFVTVSATCRVDVKVDIKGLYVTLQSREASCTINTKNKARDIMVKSLNMFVTTKVKSYVTSFFGEGIPIPLPEGVDFTQGKIDYHDGFLVVGGDLSLTPAARKKVVEKIGK